MRVDELISIIDKIRGVKICLLVIGKTDAEFVRAGIAEYEKRLKYYIPYEMKVIPDVRNTKNMSEIQQKEREGELLLGQLEAADYVILLDEKGNEYTSKAFLRSGYSENIRSTRCLWESVHFSGDLNRA